MRKIRPIADRILVKKEVIQDRKSQGGLYIPNSAGQEGGHAIGEIVDVGEGIFNEKGEFLRPLLVKKGEKVIFGKYAGINCVINDVELILMQEIDILGVVEDENN